MKFVVVGGAGFIGSYVVGGLLGSCRANQLIVYDNFTSGQHWHLKDYLGDSRLAILEHDIYDAEIFDAISGADVTIHLAANPDIAKASTEPDIDFRQGTALTQIVLEAMRRGKCSRLLYASGSGVYGDTGTQWVREDYAPMEPISTYGASKLACEALISSYCHMFGFKASCFRFGNVVGGRQTHGVAYDFLGKLSTNSTFLEILGDGSQSKPYVYVDDVVTAIFLALDRQEKSFDVYNVAPNDFITVKEIAEIVLEKLNISPSECELRFGRENRGWKGDVPIVRLITDKIRSMGWDNTYSSSGAIHRSVEAMMSNIEYLYKHA
ncbi:MAG: NAD-dependent epimerase/dehydratase family protein [Nitrospiraceae bacterium]|nr:NAD-dependent epimerase/dehydratase family protein [Nitrospiraceae bacterium]